jgi:hypothetical protein
MPDDSLTLNRAGTVDSPVFRCTLVLLRHGAGAKDAVSDDAVADQLRAWTLAFHKGND